MPVTADLIDTIVEGALRAPSAHNAQPWRLSERGADSYLLWYAFEDKLLADPDDRDGVMAMGGFYETLRLVAHSHGVDTTFQPEVSHHEKGITLGVITLEPLQGEADPLSSAIAKRQANRHKYQRTPLPPALAQSLRELGNLLLEPEKVAPLVGRASVMAWKDSRFVTDLAEWTRFNDTSPDGMTTDCLHLNATDQLALRFALHRGSLPGWLARIYSSRDVSLTKASSAMAVHTIDGRNELTLFDAGRRLIRSWTLINSLGYSWHPMSIVIDQPTVEDLSRMIEGADGVAIYRVGYTEHSAPWSKRRTAPDIVVPAPA